MFASNITEAQTFIVLFLRLFGLFFLLVARWRRRGRDRLRLLLSGRGLFVIGLLGRRLSLLLLHPHWPLECLFFIALAVVALFAGFARIVVHFPKIKPRVVTIVK